MLFPTGTVLNLAGERSLKIARHWKPSLMVDMLYLWEVVDSIGIGAHLTGHFARHRILEGVDTAELDDVRQMLLLFLWISMGRQGPQTHQTLFLRTVVF